MLKNKTTGLALWCFFLVIKITIGGCQNVRELDTLDLWNYEAHIYTKPVKGILGSIRFYRTRAVGLEKYMKAYGTGWTPSITYRIFEASDSARLFRQSLRIKIISECPQKGGDIFQAGKFMLFNQELCTDCTSEDRKNYCLTIKKMFRGIKSDEITSVHDLIAFIPLKGTVEEKNDVSLNPPDKWIPLQNIVMAKKYSAWLYDYSSYFYC